MQNRSTTTKPFFLNPIIIGAILIFLIIIYALTQLFSDKQTTAELHAKLLSTRDAEEVIDTDLTTALEVYQWINNKNVQLIDIRTADEYLIKHIESSINLPIDTISNNLDKIEKTKNIVIIDRENSEEGRILAEHLKNENLNSKYLKGGILNYARLNYPLITDGNTNNPIDQMKVFSITADEVKKKLLSGIIFSFVDTRQTHSYSKDFIDGSTNIPLETIEGSKNILPSRTLLLYDSDPTRSFKAAVKLYDMGLSNVYICSQPYSTLKQILFTTIKDTSNDKEEETQKKENIQE